MTKVLDKQNIFDLVLQQSGGINNVARVLKDNGLNFNDSLIPGAEVIVQAVESEKIKENYKLIQFSPNNEELPAEILEGVGYWIIEDTFIVS